MTALALNAMRADLAPAPGRLRGALTLTALVLLVTSLSMTLGVPEAALSCYMLFFAYRDNAGDMVFTGIKLIVAATVAIGLAIPLLNALIDAPMGRVLAIAAFTLGGMFLSQASKLGPLAGTMGFVFAFALTLVDVIPIPELLTRGMAWMWVVIALPMFVMAVVAALIAPRPVDLAQAQIQRLRTAANHPHSAKTRALLDEGPEKTAAYIRFSRLMGQARGAAAQHLAAQADDAYFQLALAEAGASPRASVALTESAPAPLREPFLQSDAFTNPRYLRFAIKVLIAVLITYGFYTAFGAFEIHTAMITCFYVALGTRGETYHKMGLRLVGCLIGALAGYITVWLAMPYMTDLGHLLLALAPVTFLAAWIALGSEKIAYAGWQIALCYFLVLLNSSGPQTDVSAATARIIGILTGSGVIWAVFAALWPESAAQDAQDQIEALKTTLDQATPPRTGQDIATLRKPLVEAERLANMAGFEDTRTNPGRHIRAETAAARSRYLTRLRMLADVA